MGEGVYLAISDICNAFVFAPFGHISPLFTFFSGDDSGLFCLTSVLGIGREIMNSVGIRRFVAIMKSGKDEKKKQNRILFG